MLPGGFDIDLYEDNAGKLYLHPMNSDWVYQTHPYLNPDYGFEGECQRLYEYESIAHQFWSKEWIYGYSDLLPLFQHPETRLIATWHNDAPWTLHKRPGRAGQKYLRLGAEDVEERLFS